MVKDGKDLIKYAQKQVDEQNKSQMRPPQIFERKETFQNDAPNFGGSSYDQSVPQKLNILLVDDDGMI